MDEPKINPRSQMDDVRRERAIHLLRLNIRSPLNMRAIRKLEVNDGTVNPKRASLNPSHTYSVLLYLIR